MISSHKDTPLTVNMTILKYQYLKASKKYIKKKINTIKYLYLIEKIHVKI